MIDNLIANGEAKWNMSSGIMLNLPHGYDGQGPEHSSGRIERFLQLVDSDYRSINVDDSVSRLDIQKCNMQVVYTSTPSNYFHVLRRQQHRTFRKPLINFFSKKLLRHPEAVSNVEELVGKKKFVPVYDDVTIKDAKKVKRVIFCSGQVYYDLKE